MAEENNGNSSSMGSNLMKMMGLRNSSKHDDRHKNLKVSSLWLFANSSFVSLVFYFSLSQYLLFADAFSIRGVC